MANVNHSRLKQIKYDVTHDAKKILFWKILIDSSPKYSSGYFWHTSSAFWIFHALKRPKEKSQTKNISNILIWAHTCVRQSCAIKMTSIAKPFKRRSTIMKVKHVLLGMLKEDCRLRNLFMYRSISNDMLRLGNERFRTTHNQIMNRQALFICIRSCVIRFRFVPINVSVNSPLSLCSASFRSVCVKYSDIQCKYRKTFKARMEI